LFLFDTPITDEWDEVSTLEKGEMLAATLYQVAVGTAGYENVKIHVEAQSEDTFLVSGTVPGEEGRRVTFLEERMSFLVLTWRKRRGSRNALSEDHVPDRGLADISA
jgi:hypothetical protein